MADGSPGPAAVPDEDPLGADVRFGVDTDGDDRADTLLATEGVDLVVHTDLDGDGLAGQVLHIGPDAAVHLTVDDDSQPEEVVSWVLGPSTGA